MGIHPDDKNGPRLKPDHERTANMLVELKRRDLAKMIAENGETEAVRLAHSKKWDIDPPCPYCGSKEHFEC